MAAQFDATARINVDLRGFASAANQVTGAGGTMSKVFQNLAQQLTNLERVNKKQAESWNRTLTLYSKLATVTTQYASAILSLSGKSRQVTSGIQNMTKVFGSLQAEMGKVSKSTAVQSAAQQRQLRLYQQITSVVAQYATAVKTLGHSEEQSARGAKAMEQAFAKLRSILSDVRGMSAAEAERLNRTIALYNRLAQVLSQVARAYQVIRSVGQADERLAQSAQRNALAQQRLAAEQDRTAAATRRNELAAQRLVLEQQRLANAAQRAENAQQRLSQQMSNTTGRSNLLRQDLSELATVYQQIGQVSSQAALSVVNAAIQHEAAFAQVARVTQEVGPALEELRNEFERLATVEPLSFEELARIGQLGAQSGIAADALADFTRVVAQFSVTTGVSSEQVTQFLGRIREMQDLNVSELRKFSSSVLAVGTASAATESEILKLIQSISTAAVSFGLVSQDITGLSGALASLRVPPEWARGTLTRIFRELDDAVKGGGAELRQLSQIMGMSVKEIQALRKSDPGEFFRRFIQSMNQFTDTARSAEENTQSVANVLRDLGVNAVRDIDLVSRLASNFDVLNSQTRIAFDEFARGTELMDQTSIIYETARVRLDNLIDAFKAFTASVGTPLLAPIGAVATALTKMIEAFNSAPDWAKWAAAAVVAFTALAAAIKLTQALIFRFIRTGIAMRETQAAIGSSSLRARDMLRAYREETSRATAAQQGLGAAQRASVSSSAALARAAHQASRAAGESFRQQAVAAQQSSEAARQQAHRMEQLAQRMERLSVATRGTAQSSQAMNTAIRAQTQAQTQYVRAIQLSAQATTLFGQSAAVLPTRFQSATVAVRTFTAAVGFARTVMSTFVLGLAVTALAGFVSSLSSMKSDIEKFADSTLDAVGGVQAFKDALRDDTAARKNKESIDSITVGYSSLNEAQKRQADQAARSRQNQENLNSILGDYAPKAVSAAKETLKVADGFNEAASAAGKMTFAIDDQVVTKRIEAITKAVEDMTKTTNKEIFGFLDIGDEEGLLGGKGGEARVRRMADSMKELTEALRGENGIEGAAKVAEREIGKLNAQLAKEEAGKSTRAARRTKSDFEKRLEADKEAWERLLAVIRSTGGLETDAANSLFLLGEAADNAKVKAKTFADELGLTQEAAENLADSFSDLTKGFSEGFAQFDLGPLAVWERALEDVNEKARREFDQSGKAVKSFQELTSTSLSEWVKEFNQSLEAVQNWSANLLRLSSQLPADVIAELAKMGPKGAGLLEQLLGADKATREKLIASVRLTTESVQVAYTEGLAKMTALLGAQGADVSKALADNMASALLDIAASGGDVDTAIQRLKLAFEQLKNLEIKPQVLFDQVRTVNDFNRVMAIIDLLAAAKKAKIAIDIDDAPARLTLEELEEWIRLQEIQGLLKAKGEAVMNDEAFRTKVETLATLVLGKEQAKAFDVNGDGVFNDEEFKAIFDALAAYIAQNDAKFDVDGDAHLDPSAFTTTLGAIQDGVYRSERNGSLDPNGKASLNPDPFDASIRAIKLTASRTATYISNTLSTTATVRVGYYYYQKNSPPAPPQTMAAKDGGWINGPGGPRDDKVPAMLSNGEFVVNAKQAARYGALLQAINSGRSGKGYSTGMARIGGAGVQMQPITIASGDLNKAMEKALIQRLPTEAVMARRLVVPQTGSGPVINITNQYPQAEPTSVTINRSLAYAATISGVS